ncbi:MAG: acetoacetate decarboxylase [Polaromonas sp. 39-63-203]|jgi:acetoacetate decarboxylase|uniref:acetoacetate decarboxylase n=1 Tax=Polaromonas sp. TaxID=1869339 RepID=UPI000BD269B9|nr:acetoacetate decarboxylase [Polaromonas sp.]OYY54160.1 MAG: acetoacetate decarboxylase [Polaromonas sp. 35-63-240]OYZ03561.1 MAG: acetoacetate decarboxylase [Polaromonas sp. 28-63-22]OYZ85343.1 MAG: acetoacetate decarboxylase [Polaromonas sp. 24-62-144]OZB02533.1 MAG: acetoacetate decarboxylase [Polaromonas sp. 39-63-203]HQS31355.1 acetoacetate decarboxylase [Polaromonas sp.]
MTADDIRRNAWAMPLASPSFPRGPYRFVDREFLVISYRTDPAALAALVPEPLLPAGDVVRFEFIRMPDSTGFGDYTESGQVIPVTYKGRSGVYVHSMFLDDDAPIAGGREIWGFPKKLGSPALRVDKDTLLGTLDYGCVRIATGTMGYKHSAADHDAVLRSLAQPNYLLKIMPHVDCSPRVCELVEYHLEEITLKGAWQGPAALQLFEHALAPVARLPVLEVTGGMHLKTDLTLGLGRVVHDYLAPKRKVTHRAT